MNNEQLHTISTVCDECGKIFSTLTENTSEVCLTCAENTAKQ